METLKAELNDIEKIETNVNFFINVLESKIKEKLQKISDNHHVSINIDVENQVVKVYDENDKKLYGDIFINVYNLMSIWWGNIVDMGNFNNLEIKPKN